MKKEYFYQTLISAFITLVISPLTIYIAFVATNVFKAEDIELKYVSYNTNLETSAFSIELQKLISQNPNALSSIVMDFMAHGLSDPSRNPDFLKSMTLINDYSKGDLSQEVTPAIACIVDLSAQKGMDRLESTYDRAVKYQDIIENNGNYDHIEDIGNIDANWITQIAKSNGKEDAVDYYVQYRNSLSFDYKVLKKLRKEASEYCDINRIKRDGTLTVKAGFVNKGFATGIISPIAKLKLGNRELPLVNSQGNKYQPISEKDFIEVSYKLDLNQLIDSELNELEELLNEKRSINVNVNFGTLETPIKHSFSISPVYEEYSFFFEQFEESAETNREG